MRKLLVLAALCAAPSFALAQSLPKALSCDGVFARDSSHARVASVFGAGNVRFAKVMDLYEEVRASVAFGGDDKRKLEFHWRDEKARKGLSSVRVGGSTSTWKTSHGIGMGTPLARIVELNGKPISIMGFGHEVEGLVGFDGGALGKLPGACRLKIHLQPGAGAPTALLDKVSGESSFSSNNPTIRALKLEVTIMSIEW